jgi:hypothetical protein
MDKIDIYQYKNHKVAIGTKLPPKPKPKPKPDNPTTTTTPKLIINAGKFRVEPFGDTINISFENDNKIMNIKVKNRIEKGSTSPKIKFLEKTENDRSTTVLIKLTEANEKKIPIYSGTVYYDNSIKKLEGEKLEGQNKTFTIKPYTGVYRGGDASIKLRYINGKQQET